MKIISFPLSLRMMTQVLEALSSSERAGTSRSHLIELWRPLIHVYKTTWHTPQLPLTHTQPPLFPGPSGLIILKNSGKISIFPFCSYSKCSSWRKGRTWKSDLQLYRRNYCQSWAPFVFKYDWFHLMVWKLVLYLESWNFWGWKRPPKINKSKH